MERLSHCVFPLSIWLLRFANADHAGILWVSSCYYRTPLLRVPWGLGAVKEGLGTGERVCRGAGEAGKWFLRSPPGLAMQRSGKWAPALPQRPDAGLVSVSWRTGSSSGSSSFLRPFKGSRLILGLALSC